MNIEERAEFLRLFQYYDNYDSDALIEQRMDFILNLLRKKDFSAEKLLLDIDNRLFSDVAAINLSFIVDKAHKATKIYFSVSTKRLILTSKDDKTINTNYLIGYTDLLQNSCMSMEDPKEITYLQFIDFLNTNLKFVLQAEANFLMQEFEKYIFELIKYQEAIKDINHNKPRM